MVVNRHAEEATARCVESIRGQRGVDPRRLEIRVIDNGSTPESLAALERLGVPLVASLRDTGVAGGANLGISRARGRYVAIVGNDTALDEGWTARGLGILADDGGIGLVGGAGLVLDLPVAAPPAGTGDGVAVATSPPLAERDVLALDGSNLLVHGDLLGRLRGFDPGFFAHYEDVDLCARVWAAGRRVVLSPGMRVRHDRGPGRDGVPHGARHLAHRNHLRLIAKHFPDDRWRAEIRSAAMARLATAVSGRVPGRARLDAQERRDHAAGGAWGLVNGHRLARARREAVARGEHYAGFVAHALREACERAA